MATSINAARAKAGYRELREITGEAPPSELNALSVSELKQLTQLVSDSLDAHKQAIAEAEERVAALAPRPLRGTVRRLLGAKKD